MKAVPPESQFLRNEQTHRRHRHEVRWQIIAPLVVAVIFFLILAGLSAFAATAGTQSHMADAALVGLILQAMTFGLIILLILAMLVFGLFRLLPLMPSFFYKIQNFFWRAQINVTQVDTKLTEPVLRMHTFTAKGRAFSRSLRRAVRWK